MANPGIDVQITADADQLMKQLKRAEASIDRLKAQQAKLRTSNAKTQKSNKGLSGSFKEMIGGVGNLSSAMKKFAGPAAVGVAVTAVAAYTMSAAKAARESVNLADALGIGAGEVRGIAIAMESLGGDLGDVRGFFAGLSVAVDEFNQGTGPAVEAFQRLGISADDLVSKDIGGQFRLIQERVEAYAGSQAEANAILSKIYGEDDAIKLSQLDRTG